MATIPDTAIKPTPDRRAAFAREIDEVGLRHFQPHELMTGVSSSRNGVANGFPPKTLWDNVVPTAIIADWAREYMGVAIEITSAYRHAGYNAEIGGADASQHRSFRALDLAPTNGDVQGLFDLLKSKRGERFDLPVPIDPVPRPTPGNYGPRGLDVREDSFCFQGGLGFYPDDGFVHVDTRGEIATW
jgi:hypothetical protein